MNCWMAWWWSLTVDDSKNGVYCRARERSRYSEPSEWIDGDGWCEWWWSSSDPWSSDPCRELLRRLDIDDDPGPGRYGDPGACWSSPSCEDELDWWRAFNGDDDLSPRLEWLLCPEKDPESCPPSMEESLCIKLEWLVWRDGDFGEDTPPPMANFDTKLGTKVVGDDGWPLLLLGWEPEESWADPKDWLRSWLLLPRLA